MSNVMPDKYRDLVQKPAFGFLSTLMPDGEPQVTPVWLEADGDDLLINSAKGRRKDTNMRRDPRVALTISDPDNPYRYMEVRGRVTEITEDGADQQIDRLAKKYLNADTYPYRQPGEIRVKYRIRPEHISGRG